ncbi:MAG: tyrosine phosphatase family protein [Candidatus Aminicenantales bacterium]
MVDKWVRHTICGLEELPGHGRAGVTHLLSLLDPDAPEPGFPELSAPLRRLTLRFHDVIAPSFPLVAPEPAHVEALLAFGRTLPGTASDTGLAHLLVHCHMGVSRSTAAMAALLAQAHPELPEESIMARIAEIRPQAWPNSRLVRFADAQLGRDGRLVAALGWLYARQLARHPYFAEGLRNGGRAEEMELARS